MSVSGYKIEDIATIVNGGTPKTGVAEYWDGAHQWITPAEMGGRETPYINSSRRTLTDVGIQKCSANLLPEKSVILSSRAPIGHLVINTVPMAFNQGCKGLIPSEKIYYKYLYYFLLCNIDLLNDLGTGTTFKELSATKLKSVIIPVLSIAEQKLIVEILDEAFAGIDQAIANTEKNLASARELFESYLNSIFNDEKYEWQELAMKDVYDVRDGTHDSPKYQDSGYPLITSKNLKSEGLTYDKAKFISEDDYININKRSAVHKGDVLFAMIGTIGNPIVVEVEPDFAIKNVALFKVPENRNGHFLKYYLNTKFVIEKMTSEAKGTTQKFVGLGYLRAFPMKIVDPDKELEIVENIKQYEDFVLKLESSCQQKLTALNELKQSLLQKAFRGELTADMAENTQEDAA